MDTVPFNVARDRLGPRLRELARLLDANPANAAKVRDELHRLANG